MSQKITKSSKRCDRITNSSSLIFRMVLRPPSLLWCRGQLRFMTLPRWSQPVVELSKPCKLMILTSNWMIWRWKLVKYLGSFTATFWLVILNTWRQSQVVLPLPFVKQNSRGEWTKNGSTSIKICWIAIHQLSKAARLESTPKCPVSHI